MPDRATAATWESEYAEYFAARAVPLRRIAFALCGDWHLAEDLVQTTFVQLFRHWQRLRRESLDAYTRRTLVNTFLNDRRAKRRERVVAQVPESPAAAQEGGADDVRAVLDALPPRQRALVVLRHLDGVSIAEAAELLGISEGSVKSLTSRGLAALRTSLKGVEDGL